MTSLKLDSQDISRKKWTHEEDVKLVQALLEHYNEENDKQETKFQPGYLKILEGKLSKTLPNFGLKAKPHIESRLKTLKKDFQVIHNILCGPNTSGFGWDSIKKYVVVEDVVWQAYVQSNKGAAAFRHKSFPLYEDLCIVYAKDHATSKHAQASIDMFEEIQHERIDQNSIEKDMIEEVQGNMSSTHMSTKDNEGSSSRKRKKRSQIIENDFTSLIEFGNMLGKSLIKSLITASDNLCKAVARTVASENRSKLNEELSKIVGLSIIGRHKTARLIVCQLELMDLFFSIPDEERKVWVLGLLNDV